MKPVESFRSDIEERDFARKKTAADDEKLRSSWGVVGGALGGRAGTCAIILTLCSLHMERP